MAINPAVDPQFLAFQRALGLEDAELQAAANYRKTQILVSYGARQPDYDRKIELGQRRVDEDFEARGVHGSGVRVERRNEVKLDTERERAQDELETQAELAGVDLDVTRQLASNRRRAAEAQLGYSASAATNAARGVLTPYIQGA